MYKRKYWLIFLLLVLCITLPGCGQDKQGILSGFSFGEKLSNPTITEHNMLSDGIEIKWDAIQDADRYQVYRKVDDEDWSMMSETESLTYLDRDVANEQSYSYFVSAVSDHIKTENADMDESPYVVSFYDMPQDLVISNGYRAVHLEWKSMNSIDRYKIFRKEVSDDSSASIETESTSSETDGYAAEDGWQELMQVDGHSYDDGAVINGHTYSYTICCVDRNDEQISAYDEIGQSIIYIEAPSIAELNNTLKGVAIQWNPVEGVKKYRIYRQIISEDDAGESDGQAIWDPVAIVDSMEYTDTKVDNNVRYAYSVSCLDSVGKNEISSYDQEGASITYYHAPEGMKIANTTNGVKLVWTPVDGVSNYNVYRQIDGEAFGVISVANGSDYLDNDVQSGQEYKYTVSCLGDDGTTEISAYDDQGVGIHYISTPDNIQTQNIEKGISVSWDKCQGAENYRVYKKSIGGKWTKVKDSKKNTITDTKVKSGTEYVYTVKCMDKKGKEGISSFDPNGKTQLYLAPIKGNKVNLKNTNDGINITWPKIAGADSYVLYRGSADKEMGRIGVVNGGNKTEYVDADRKNGKLYTYAVRARSAKSGEEVLGYFAKKKVVCLKQSAINSLKAKVESFTVNWKGNNKASNYEIQYSTDSNFKKNIKTVTASADSRSKTLNNLNSDKKYYVRVRSYTKENNKKYFSAWTKAKSVKPKKKPAPKPSAPTRSSTGMTGWSGTMVWIPRTGHKYHSDPDCSGMKNPSQVTLDDAESMGYDRCSKCW